MPPTILVSSLILSRLLVRSQTGTLFICLQAMLIRTVVMERKPLEDRVYEPDL